MVAIIERDKEFKFMTNKELFNKAKVSARSQGISISRALDLFVKQVAITGKIDLISEEELSKEWAIREIQETVQSSIRDYEEGRTVSLEKARERFGV